MANVNAFVAHSFGEDDKAMIQTFIDHFESLAGTLPEFSWDHAQKAEPTSVSGKVLGKFEGKNVFIGICSKTEYVAAPKRMRQVPVLAQLWVKNSDVQWKTSDWIIHEIGAAVGRGMKAIIFLEEGVRTPGGLFSDIEYIPFRRENPQASFDNLLQMLGTFMPKTAATASGSAVEAKPTPPDKLKEEKIGEDKDDLEPSLEWDQDKYDHAAFRTIIQRNADALVKIDAAYRASPLSKGSALAAWEATLEWYRMLLDQKANFEKFKSAVDVDPKNPRLLSYLAIGYSDFGEHRPAAQTYERAAECAKSDEDRNMYLIDAAREYRRAGAKGTANAIVDKLKLAAEGGDQQTAKVVLEYLSQQASDNKEELFQLAVMEKIAALDPTNTKARFDLAYRHSQAGNSDMSLYHYERIPSFARDASAWNNLGVAYGEAGLRVKSVDAFRESEKSNETLAMSNLGSGFLDAGFINEAKKEADKALAIKNYHENIPALIKRIRESPEEEAEKHKEALEKVKEKAEFYRKAADGVLKPTPAVLIAKWKSPSEDDLEFKIEGQSFCLFGEYQRPSLGGLLSGLALGNVMVKHTVEYTGQVCGHVITGKVKRTDGSGAVRSLLASGGGSETKVIMVLSEDQSQLFVAEAPDSSRPTFYTLERLPLKV